MTRTHAAAWALTRAASHAADISRSAWPPVPEPRLPRPRCAGIGEGTDPALARSPCLRASGRAGSKPSDIVVASSDVDAKDIQNQRSECVEKPEFGNEGCEVTEAGEDFLGGRHVHLPFPMNGIIRRHVVYVNTSYDHELLRRGVA